MTGSGGPHDTNMTMVAIAVVVVSVMIAVSGYGMMLMFEKLDTGTQEYKKSWYYSTSGTHTAGEFTFEFEGEGESKYVSETDGFRTYDFTFRAEDLGGAFTVKASLICDDNGVPIDVYTFDGEDDGVTFWTYSESGTDYRFGIKDERAVSVNLTSAEVVLEAVIKS